MEKFAVDLDKVLDDFEFNEEQAVVHNNYICDELPAKKYQRPPFQRINLADADFSPSKQTSSPYPPEISRTKQSAPLYSSTPYLPIDAIKSVTTSTTCQNGSNDAHPIVHEQSAQIIEIINKDNLIDESTDDDGDSDSEFDEVPNGYVQEAGPIPDLLGNDLQNLVSLNLPDLTERSDKGNEPDIVGCNSMQCIPDIAVASQPCDEYNESHSGYASIIHVPAPPEISQDIVCVPSVALESEPVATVPLTPLSDISNNVKSADEQLADDEDEVTKDLTKSLEICDAGPEAVFESNKDVEKCHNSVTASVKELVISLDIKADNLKPCPENTVKNEDFVQFVEESDISEEELAKYLETLEEEEALNECHSDIKSPNIPSAEANCDKSADSMPQRPNSLDLRSDIEQDLIETADVTAAPVDTPATVDAISVTQEKAPAEDLDNAINEKGEANASTDSASADFITKDEEEASHPVLSAEERRLGKVSPFWVPDADALNCMQCGLKFTVMKRRHHCRACGRVLCSKCCDMRATIEYLSNQEHRVCELCFRTLTKVMMYDEMDSEAECSPQRRPNPNNPMEYCSMVPPPLQASPSSSEHPPSVLVPVLKREGTVRTRDPQRKVMFSDGIRPGGELTCLDEQPAVRAHRAPHGPKRVGTPPGSVVPSPVRILPPVDPTSQSFILEQCLPPICEIGKGALNYMDPWPREAIIQRLRAPDEPPLLFAVNRHLVVALKIVKKECCIGHTCWVFATRGMAAVGQDEIVVLLQSTEDENEPIPVEIFMQLHYIYQSADKGSSVGDLGYWSVKQSTFLDSRQHGGFLFVRPSFQCVQNVHKPSPPYLVAILIHRLELPWARQFPLRLMLRLGAEFRYYPCSLVSIRHREPVYYELGQTILKLLADFRNYTFTLPSVRGLRIHMEAQQTSVLIPKNRYDQLVRALNNSNEPVLALAGCFSPDADAHLVCMQSKSDEVTYTTQAINIHDKPRKVTGASFVVFNASLKATGGMEGKSHIVEDGLMVEISADTMALLRGKLRACEDWAVRCGATGEELIQINWTEDDKDFNRGVRSVIDGTSLDGVPSIRVHNGTDYMCSTRFIRWTEVFIVKCEDGVTSAKIGDPVEVKRLSENIARATCTALTKAQLLDLLATSEMTTLALRATLAPELVCYEAGSRGEKLAPIYMNSLDNELIPVLHKATAGSSDATTVLELIFHILDQ